MLSEFENKKRSDLGSWVVKRSKWVLFFFPYRVERERKESNMVFSRKREENNEQRIFLRYVL